MKTISLTNIVKTYKRTEISGGALSYFKSLFRRNKKSITAINELSLEINDGEIVSLVGENGAGKSTLIKMMDGILIPSSGKVRVLGYNPFDKKKEFLNQIGVVMGQKNQLWWDLSPKETFLLYKSIYKLSSFEFEANLSELIQSLKIENVIDSPTRTLSLGERMKCELVCALLHKPKILFLDEPTIGLDFIAQKEIHRFLLEYKARQETTIVLTSHYMSDIEALSDRIIVLSRGSKIYDGKLKNLKKITTQYVYLSVQLNNRVPNTSVIKESVVDSNDYALILKIRPDSIDNYLKLLQQNNSIRGYSLREMNIQDLLEQLYVNGEKDDNKVY